MSQDRPRLDCDWVQSRIELHVDAELARDESARLVIHCSDCRICGDELKLAMAVKKGLEELTSLACPPEVTERVISEVSASSRRLSESRSVSRQMTLVRPLWKPVAAAAAAAAVVLAILSAPFEQDQAPTQAEVDQALVEAKYALAVISDAGRRTGVQVAADVETTVLQPMRQMLDNSNKREL